MLADGVRWFDDWFAIETINPGLIAIGEPRFHYNNWNYLIIGETAALLFDTGPGIRNIASVVRTLTNKPLTVLASHMHFDHTGNFHHFENIAMADLPVLRACQKDGMFHCSPDLFLGSWVGQTWQPCRVSQWLPIGHRFDLGGRVLELLHTPGHSPDSVALWEAASQTLLIADYIYPGPLYAQVPGADLGRYLATATELLAKLPPAAKLLAAHGAEDADGHFRAPVLAKQDVADLKVALETLQSSGQTPTHWPVNQQISLLTAPHAFAAWQSPL
jgi:hydroxyacylglutathione hydrolase